MILCIKYFISTYCTFGFIVFHLGSKLVVGGIVFFSMYLRLLGGGGGVGGAGVAFFAHGHKEVGQQDVPTSTL